MWGMIWLPWLWCLGYFATPKQGVTKGERARWRFPGGFCWVLSLGMSLFGCWRWAHPLESEVEFPVAKRKTLEMFHVFLLGLRSATGQPMATTNSTSPAQVKLPLIQRATSPTVLTSKSSFREDGKSGWWNMMKLLIPFDPCLISMFDFQRFTRPETVGSLAGAHIPSVLDVQTPSIRFSAARALTLRRTQRVFFNVSTFILYLLYPSPIQDYFTDVLSKQTPSFCFKVKNVYIRDYPVARVKANSSEAEPQWQKLAT